MSLDQLDLLDAIEVAQATDGEPDMVIEQERISDLLWLVRAIHKPTGISASTTVPSVPMDPDALARLARVARGGAA